jgi:hypothetical protein
VKRRKQRPIVKQENEAEETQDKPTNSMRGRRRKPTKWGEGSTPAEGPPEKEAATQEQETQDQISPKRCPKKTPEKRTGEEESPGAPSRRGRKKRKSVNALSNVEPGRDELARGTFHTRDFGSEQEETEALVRSLRACAQKRGGRDGSGRLRKFGSEEELPGGQQLGGGQGGGEAARCVREAKEKCMWAIMDLLGKLPSGPLIELFSTSFSNILRTFNHRY